MKPYIEGVHVLGNLAVKRCSSCWVTRPLSMFHDDPGKRDGMRSNCQICRRISRVMNR